MKLFANLSELHKERALHMAEHIILDGILENGIDFKPENDEEQVHLKELQEVLDEAKALPSFEDQADHLFNNNHTGDFIMEKAYQMAVSSVYLEAGETAFYLDQIDSHYADETEENIDLEGEDKDDIKDLIKTSPNRNTKQLN